MRKICEVCRKPFMTKEGKQKACGNSCGNVLRKQTAKIVSTGLSSTMGSPKYLREEDLPPPEVLPSAYLKRCYDYWTSLTGDPTDFKKRIV